MAQALAQSAATATAIPSVRTSKLQRPAARCVPRKIVFACVVFGSAHAAVFTGLVVVSGL